MRDIKILTETELRDCVKLDLAAGVDVECHLFAKGGHGYGLRDQGHPTS